MSGVQLDGSARSIGWPLRQLAALHTGSRKFNGLSDRIHAKSPPLSSYLKSPTRAFAIIRSNGGIRK